ncbi:thioredoxin [Ectothiorhodospiraceae bacterium BW-2]|nr:thioredoxin [Ectothiorhodospiraceae bacterium BW-2]
MVRESWRCVAAAFGLVGFMVVGLVAASNEALESDDFDFAPAFYDRPVDTGMLYPPWFRLSFLDLKGDLQEALAGGREGLALYFSQKNCPYCEAMVKNNFAQSEIEHYARRHFDFISIDIHGSRSVTPFSGEEVSEKELAQHYGVDFTPTILFFDRRGELIYRLNGYHPPYQFLSVLEYVADRHYLNESLSHYMGRGEVARLFAEGEMAEEPFFMAPPYALARHQVAAQRPLVVFFERPVCHACDILHSQPLQHGAIQRLLRRFDVVQLNRFDGQTPVLTPSGERTTAREWADSLDIFYTPTLIFYDQQGEEVMRIDSVIGFLRLRSVLDYVLSGVYRRGISFQEYRMVLWNEFTTNESN